MDLKAQLAALRDLDPDTLSVDELRVSVTSVLLVIEELVVRDAVREAELVRLREELARLKGQSPRPKVPPTGGAAGSGSGSSEADRRAREGRKPWTKGSKLAALPVDREVVLRLDPATLPPDAVFKGYTENLIQDLVIQRDNVLFRREQYYSAAKRRTYTAPLPPGYRGQFGPGLRSLALTWTYGANVTMRLTHKLFTHFGTRISVGEVSALVTTGLEAFEAELREALDAGLSQAGWTGVDQTSTRVDGRNHSCQVLANPLVSAYLTTPRGDRLAVLRALQGGRPLRYRIDATAVAWFSEKPAAAWAKQRLAELQQEAWLAEPELEALVRTQFSGAGEDTQNWVRQATALAAYRQEPHGPRLFCLVSDDAAVFPGLTAEQALCWVHDARHYHKLSPEFAIFRDELQRFQKSYWDFYALLLGYREAPTAAEAERLAAEFDQLFATEVRYAPLARCIERTRANKERLLLVLRRPELPLHNNATELTVRQRVRRRDVSFGPRSEAGRRAWDVYQSLAATVEKLGVSFVAYLQDRIGKLHQIPPLAELVAQRAEALQVGRSWPAV